MRATLRIRQKLPSIPATIRSQLASGPSITEGATASCRPAVTEVNGWIRSVRAHKNVAFAEIDDGTGGSIQAVLKGKGRADGLTLGSSVSMRGALLPSRGAGQALELLVDEAKILGPADPETYPIQKKALPASLLRENAHLRYRTGQGAAVARVRDALERDWHDWFEDHEFVRIHTPVLTSSDCEGAGETFTLSEKTPTEPFFGKPVNLTVSGQLHLEAPTLSLSRCYTLGPCFRAEASQTNRHLSEFYMLEGEVSFVRTLPQLLDVVEAGFRDTLKHLLESDGARAVRERADLERIRRYRATEVEEEEGDEISSAVGGQEGEQVAQKDGEQVAQKDGEHDALQHLRNAASKPFARISYTEVIGILQQQHAKQAFQHKPDWNEGLTSEQEKWLAGEYFNGPVFVTDYPASQKPFYMLPSEVAQQAELELNGTPLPPLPPSPTVSAFDLLFPGIGEMVGGSLREHRLDALESAIERSGLKTEDYKWYLDLRRYGSVPHGGWGMGWDRWVSFVTGVNNIRDVVPFPRWVGSCRF